MHIAIPNKDIDFVEIEMVNKTKIVTENCPLLEALLVCVFSL